uniref:Ribosomal RNA-processing protein 8 n=1 Tax=Panagrolaimus sp. JU765 TaxID=591449 RepID=A0AC34RIB9_9BILA
MSESETVAVHTNKKRKRPWRQSIRRKAKLSRIEELKSKSETCGESKKELENILEKSNAKRQNKTGKIKKEKDPDDKRKDLEEKLASSKFRYLNEQLYTMSSKDASNIFAEDRDAYTIYHKGYRQQAMKWPVNPVDKIIEKLKKFPEGTVVADLGCGDAKIANVLGEHLEVNSFDFVANNANVIACDMAHLPLEAESVDVVVFCLSLMGTNLSDFLREANRILKEGGRVFIAEVWSRFSNLKKFLEALQKLGFSVIEEKLINDYFEMITLEKTGKVQIKKPLGLTLEPCFYKKR